MRVAHITLFLILTQEFTFSLQNLKNQSFQKLFDKTYQAYQKYDLLPEGLHYPNEKKWPVIWIALSLWCIQNIELVYNHWITKNVDLLGNKYFLNIGRFPEVWTAGRTSHPDNEKCFVFHITPYSLRDRAMKLQHQKIL